MVGIVIVENLFFWCEMLCAAPELERWTDVVWWRGLKNFRELKDQTKYHCPLKRLWHPKQKESQKSMNRNMDRHRPSIVFLSISLLTTLLFLHSYIPETSDEDVNEIVQSKMPDDDESYVYSTSINSGECRDDPDFFYNDNPKNTCKKLREKEQKVRDLRCKKDHISSNCPKTCGQCEKCQDDEFFTFLALGASRNCKWIGEQSLQDEVCDMVGTGWTVRDACAATCLKCKIGTPTPSSSPSQSAPPTLLPSYGPPLTSNRGLCDDDPYFFYNDNPKKTCQQLGEKDTKVRNIRCKRDDIKSNCPKTCGQCTKCKDDDLFTFRKKGASRNCNWISSKGFEAEVCDEVEGGVLVRDACAATCQNCKIGTPTPSLSPSHSATPTITFIGIAPGICTNNDSFRFEGKRCLRLGEIDRIKYCKIDVVRDNCPRMVSLVYSTSNSAHLQEVLNSIENLYFSVVIVVLTTANIPLSTKTRH